VLIRKTSTLRFDSPHSNEMIRAKHIYIAGQKCPDSSNRKWTDAEIDAAYAIVCQSLGLVNPPPNQWYPLNSLGYSIYSITRRGHLLNNKFNRLIKGTICEGRPKFRMTNDSGVRKVSEYASRLVASMFLPPPPFDTFSVVRYRDDNPLNCDVSNLYWACDKSKDNEPVGKPSAKVVRPPKALMDKTIVIHFQRTPYPFENKEAIDSAIIAGQFKEAWNAPVTKSTKQPTFPEMPSSPLWEDEDEEEYAKRMNDRALSQRRPKTPNGDDDYAEEEEYVNNNNNYPIAMW
jgi:hypothetical protein